MQTRNRKPKAWWYWPLIGAGAAILFLAVLTLLVVLAIFTWPAFAVVALGGLAVILSLGPVASAAIFGGIVLGFALIGGLIGKAIDYFKRDGNAHPIRTEEVKPLLDESQGTALMQRTHESPRPSSNPLSPVLPSTSPATADPTANLQLDKFRFFNLPRYYHNTNKFETSELYKVITTLAQVRLTGENWLQRAESYRAMFAEKQDQLMLELTYYGDQYREQLLELVVFEKNTDATHISSLILNPNLLRALNLILHSDKCDMPWATSLLNGIKDWVTRYSHVKDELEKFLEGFGEMKQEMEKDAAVTNEWKRRILVEVEEMLKEQDARKELEARLKKLTEDLEKARKKKTTPREGGPSVRK